MKPEPQTVRLIIRPEPGNYQSPPIKRLALLLKTMLRGFGWRCVECSPVTTTDEVTTDKRVTG